ncbi:unnamed protein product [Owenia fusiformis]|uniref:DUF7869 domain-containing protein n=1 Tax=Owenia fusiformis TaxID=6347 RepID=A0A8S4Q7B9_OWEFU|nr:unnamed protein product [Owenia fusiformis]
MDDLLSLLKNGQRINVVYNFRKWIEPHLDEIKHHTKPLHFKFIKTSNGVKLLYKGLHTQPWVEAPSILKTLPQGEPDIQTPNFEKLNIDGIQRNQRFLRPLYSDQRDGSQYIWWQKYIKHVRALLASDELVNQYLLRNKKQWMLDGLPKLSAEEDTNIDSAIPIEIARMLEIEQEQPSVSGVITKVVFNYIQEYCLMYVCE